MFPPLENGLVLLEHINQHLEEGLGLRQILDWALYVDKALDDDAWEYTFAPVVRRLGLERLAITVTRMCQLYLGLRSDITWCASADEKVCDSLMNYIMEQGNFGRNPFCLALAALPILSTTPRSSFWGVALYEVFYLLQTILFQHFLIKCRFCAKT